MGVIKNRYHNDGKLGFLTKYEFKYVSVLFPDETHRPFYETVMSINWYKIKIDIIPIENGTAVRIVYCSEIFADKEPNYYMFMVNSKDIDIYDENSYIDYIDKEITEYFKKNGIFSKDYSIQTK